VTLRRGIAGCSVAGIAIAAYLTVIHYSNTAPICGTGGCETVQHSSYAKLAGVPVALLGLFAYAGILATTLRRGVETALAGAVLALTGAAFSGYLLWAQIARIHAICQWCLGNDVVVGIAACLCVWRLLSEPHPSQGTTLADRSG
jgi:uncharacterized membrane protein